MADLLIRLAGAVALLLWGVHMVRSGVERAFGARLGAMLRTALRSRPRAFLAGLGVTAAIQSSTATGLMTASFVASGRIALASGLAAMLGANVGSALIVQAISFDTGLAYPVLILAGLVAFRRGGPRVHDLGRAAIGLGLMLLALRLLVEAVAPTSLNPTERDLLAALTGDPFGCLLAAALLAFAAHSSVAVMAVILSLAAAGLVTPLAALAMVLGANLGSAINPVLAFRNERAGLRLALGNLATRVVGCVLIFPLLSRVTALGAALGLGPARDAASFHLAFNLVLAAGFILVLPPFARLLNRLLPTSATAEPPGAPRHLDPAALGEPATALTQATREVLRMVDVLAAMLERAKAVMHVNDRQQVSEIRRMDDVLDGLHDAVARYGGELRARGLSPADGRRLSDVLAFATHLEHAGDVVERSLMSVAAKKAKADLSLPPEALAVVDEMFARLASDLELAGAVFLNGDPATARRLFEAKEQFSVIEHRAAERHLERLGAPLAGGQEGGALLLDALRDLKRIEAHIAGAAQPVLRAHGLLQSSRLVSLPT